jgi:hypothetical protein
MEIVSMSGQCSFYRDPGIKYCDLDGHQTTCNGDLKVCEDIQFSEKPDALSEYLQTNLDGIEKRKDKEK